MARIQAGDHAAFEQLVERHLSPIHAYSYRLCRSRADADDLAQETFFKVWQRAETWRPSPVRVSTWLHRIAHNTFIDVWRRRDNAEPLDDQTAIETPLENDSAESPDSRTVVIGRALDTLPLNQRTAVALSLISDFSMAETAVIMGMTPHAVESLIARARRALRKHAERASGMEG
ncbi:MAG: sigma-70 family RNA polymerase sigma factor [Gammaproteobacteria bacterium]|nr:sigma-70 family RNA polymerase sigma factor [Gammaproteobacteria bacterium]